MQEVPTPTEGTRNEDIQRLRISPEKACFKAKEYDRFQSDLGSAKAVEERLQ